ncbi:MAG: sensor histidine kinase [Candidatus Limnocylindrales bacterium]
MVLPLALRRVWPSAVAVLVASGIILTSGRLEVVDLAAFAVASFSLGDGAASRRRSLALLAAITGVVGLWFTLDGSAYALALGYLVTLPAWLAGDWWRERRTRAAARSEAEALERDDRVRRAVLDERRRLARELHDVVAHSVGIMVVQAGGARQVLDSSPDRARAALQTVESTGREALTELRRLLDLLADDRGPEAALEPHPTLSDVDAMVARLRDAGVPVRLQVEGQPSVLPDGLSTTAYRIVQEALTNAMRHAHGAQTSVVISYAADAVVLEVTDEGARPTRAVSAPSGRGLTGMRERAEAWGGTLEAGPREGRGFAVEARLPLSPAGTPTDA